MHTVSLLLEPADVCLFREPRPFTDGGQAWSLLPSPETTAGAIRTWLLRGLGVSFRGLAAEARRLGDVPAALRALCPTGHPGNWVIDAHFPGPLLCLSPSGIPWLPAPLHLAQQEGQARLRRRLPWRDAPPGVSSPDGNLPAFRPAGGPQTQEWETVSGYLDVWQATQSLGLQSAPSRSSLQPEEGLYGWEPRVGIGVDFERKTAEDERLFSVAFLRLTDQTAFRVDILTDANVLAAIQSVCAARPWLWLGGEGRTARVSVLDAAAPWPSPAAVVPERFCTYLATPALFAEGRWYPSKLLETCDLISAVVGSPLLFSSWDRVQNQPRPPRQAVRAGAVHFWKVRDPAHPPDDPHGTCLSDRIEDRQAGWGLCLRGEWDYV